MDNRQHDYTLRGCGCPFPMGIFKVIRGGMEVVSRAIGIFSYVHFRARAKGGGEGKIRMV